MSDEQPTTNADRGNGDFSTGLRLGLAAALGHSGYADRDRYDVFGWEKTPTADEYYGLYLRNPYAYAAVAQKPATTWRDPPAVIDGTHDKEKESIDEENLTEFERRVRALDSKHDLWSYASRADRMSGIGTHGLLVLDLADTDEPSDFADVPSFGGSGDTDGESAGMGLDALRGFRVYSAVSIDDIDYGGPGSDRWGSPEIYHIDLREDPVNEDSQPGTEDVMKVHHSRVIDIPARPLDDDETHARPRIEVVLNTVYDIEKTLGAAAELAYSGAKQDIHVNFDPDEVDPSTVSDNDDELQNWYHNRQPWIRTTGGEVEQISPPEVVDPSGVIDAELRAFSAATNIPKQLLDGSAAGELAAAEQNERDYFGEIGERRTDYATPHLVRETLDRLIMLGLLPAPEGQQDSIGPDYRVNWPDLTELSEADVANIRNTRAQMVKRLQMAVPELSGERAETVVETGEFPERDDFEPEPMDIEAERERMAGTPPSPQQPAVPDGGSESNGTDE
jgi:hypothetical protein